jgi:CDP-glucose 4,6-dehydratase
LEVNIDFWRGRKVFITGHTGFKGGWLSLWLQELGAEIMGYSLLPSTTPNLFKVASIGSGMTTIIGDIRDVNSLREAVKSFKPEIIFHLAAQSLVMKSYADPIDTYSTNFMGTINLFEAARGCDSVRAIINVTSDKCYENREWDWGYRETDPMGGYDPYSNSKGCAELLTSAYRNSFFNKQGVSLASARAGNVIGGGDWAEYRLIPDIFRALANGQSLIVRSPQSIRPWQHVLEPLAGYITLSELLFTPGNIYADGWNFGPNDEDVKTVGWIINRLSNELGGRIECSHSEGSQLHEANYLKLDCSKAKNHLNWKPRWNIQEALEKIVDWHREFINGGDMRQFSIGQINKYMDKQ